MLWYIMNACVIMHNMIIENECGQDNDYLHYELMGRPMRVCRRAERVACFIALYNYLKWWCAWSSSRRSHRGVVDMANNSFISYVCLLYLLKNYMLYCSWTICCIHNELFVIFWGIMNYLYCCNNKLNYLLVFFGVVFDLHCSICSVVWCLWRRQHAAFYSARKIIATHALIFWAPDEAVKPSAHKTARTHTVKNYNAWPSCLHVGDWCLVGPVGKPQEEGMMSTTVSFSSVWNQGLIDQ
jgi:hypothetical protein